MISRDKVCGMILGTIVGDTVGQPFESKSWEELNKFRNVKSYLNQWQGHMTDDSQLTTSTMKAMIEAGINMDVIADYHVKAYKASTSGWGSTTRDAIRSISEGTHWSKSGLSDGKHGFGNGVVMKAAPFAAYFAVNQKFEDFAKILVDFTAMTHQTSMAVSSCFAHVTALMECLNSTYLTFDVKTFIRKVVRASEVGRNYFSETLTDDLTDKLKSLTKIHEIPDLLFDDKYIITEFGRGSCYVYNSLPMSYAFFIRGPFSIESLFDVALAGGDTDTNASLVGGLLGALRGTSVFPLKLVSGIGQIKEILETVNQFCDKLGIK